MSALNDAADEAADQVPGDERSDEDSADVSRLGPRSDASSARPERPPWSDFRTALEGAQFRPSKKLGQNFLLDDNMARAIASDAAVTPGQFTLEIGPGCGFLSVHLAHAGAKLLCVEIDTRLAPIARSFLAPYPDAEVIECDILASKNAFHPDVLARLPKDGAPWTVAANLPYSISGPILGQLAQLEHPPHTVCCLVQKEVAARLAAAPGSAEWGPLSASFREAFEVTMGRPVPAQLFWPRPKVMSAVFTGTLRADLGSADDRRRRIAFSRTLLGRRRQTVGRVLRDMVGAAAASEALSGAGVDPSARAESLAIETLRAISDGCVEGDER